MEIPIDFTVRDLNRNPARVLAACERIGVVRIRSRKGMVYELRARPVQPETGDEPAGVPDFARRRKAIGLAPMTKEQSAALDRLIAGE